MLIHFRNRSVCASDFAHPGVAFMRVGLGNSPRHKAGMFWLDEIALKMVREKGILVWTSKESGGFLGLYHFLPTCPVPARLFLPVFPLLAYSVGIGGNPVCVKAWKVVSFHAFTSYFLFVLFETSSPHPRLLSRSSLFPWGQSGHNIICSCHHPMLLVIILCDGTIPIFRPS